MKVIQKTHRNKEVIDGWVKDLKAKVNKEGVTEILILSHHRFPRLNHIITRYFDSKWELKEIENKESYLLTKKENHD